MINKLELLFYRNFTQTSISCNARNILIYGKNGEGKTNILEAISYLFPGRGMRSSTYHDLCNMYNKATSPYWQLKATSNEWDIAMSYSEQQSIREVTLNNNKINALELSELHNILWITPKMDRIFAGSTTERRKFLDRLIYSFDNHHASYIKKYDYLLKERLTSLVQTNYDSKLLQILEHQIADLAIKIINGRTKFIERLQQIIIELPEAFPQITLTLDGYLEKLSGNNSAEEIRNQIIQKLLQHRNIDAKVGKTTFAPHRSEFNAIINNKIPAKLCSTGQQKIILLSIIMSQVLLLTQTNQLPIILLLDELFVHLDEPFRKTISEWLDQIADKHDIQSWITSTDLQTFEFLTDTNASFINITSLVNH